MKDTPLTPERPVQFDRKLNKKALFLTRVKRKFLAKHIYLARFLIAGVFVLFLGLLAYGGVKLLDKTGVSHTALLAKNFIFPSEKHIKGFEGRTNILFLGRAGEGTTSPDLTDTIMLVSLDHQEKSVTMISFPRDIWIPALKAKLNSAYYWGNLRQENGGMILAKSTIEEIAGVPIHYGAVVDFAGFTRLIDSIGGVEVEVLRTFTDEEYPIAGKENDLCDGDPKYRCRYETITFTKGVHHMDGTTALKFVRSRHSKDLTEGTDLARAARQQQVLKALKEKIISPDFFLSYRKVRSFYDAGWDMIETDIPDTSMATLARWGFNARGSINSHVVPEELLINPPISNQYERQYVFIPKGDNWEEIQKWVDSILQ